MTPSFRPRLGPAFLLAATLCAGTARGEALETPGPTVEDREMMTACLEALGKEPAPDGSWDAEACIGAASTRCMDAPGGSTTLGMGDCLARETAWWDEGLNDAYAILIDELAPEAASDLREAQRTWIAFRDADCAFVYQFWIEGSIRTVTAGQCLLETTARRAITLEGYLGWR